jgi:hypothetical protein
MASIRPYNYQKKKKKKKKQFILGFVWTTPEAYGTQTHRSVRSSGRMAQAHTSLAASEEFTNQGGGIS